MCGHTRDPVIFSKFHRNPCRGFGAPGSRNLAFPITLASRFYNSLYYRTSRDYRAFQFYRQSLMVKLKIRARTVRAGADFHFSTQVTWVINHSKLPLLSDRPAVTFPASERHRPWPVPIYTAWRTESHVWTTCLESVRVSRTIGIEPIRALDG